MRGIISKVKADVLAFWNVPLVSRAIHAFWEAAVASLLVTVFAAHNSTDVKASLIGAVSLGLSAVKTMFWSYVKGQK
jgi:uncharacterized integral membrane protein